MYYMKKKNNKEKDNINKMLDKGILNADYVETKAMAYDNRNKVLEPQNRNRKYKSIK